MDPRTVPLVLGAIVGMAVSLVFWSETPQRTVREPLSYCESAPPQPLVEATAAYALDIETGEALFEKNSGSPLALASLTKVMTVLTALDTLALDDRVSITRDALLPEGASGLVEGEVWFAGDLAEFTLIESSNDGSRALMLAAAEKMGFGESGFTEAMNRRARAMSLTTAFFLNETGLDVSSTTAGAYASARDVAHLFAYVAMHESERVERSVMPEMTFTSLSGRTHVAENTSLLASTLASASVSKTGFTDLAGGNLALVFEPMPGRPVAIAVLGSSRDGRVSDVERIVAHVRELEERSALCSLLYD